MRRIARRAESAAACSEARARRGSPEASQCAATRPGASPRASRKAAVAACACDAIGAGKMILASHFDPCAEAAGGVVNTLVVGRDDEGSQIPGHRRALVDVFKHGARIDVGQRLAGKTG